MKYLSCMTDMQLVLCEIDKKCTDFNVYNGHPKGKLRLYRT